MTKRKHVLTVGDIVQAKRSAAGLIRTRHYQILTENLNNSYLTFEQVREVECVLHVLIDALNHLEGRGIAIPGLYTRQLFEEV